MFGIDEYAAYLYVFNLDELEKQFNILILSLFSLLMLIPMDMCYISCKATERVGGNQFCLILYRFFMKTQVLYKTLIYLMRNMDRHSQVLHLLPKTHKRSPLLQRVNLKEEK